MRISSKKSRLMSIEKVETNDELLSAILVRLPPPSIFKFKCVSKRWNDILRDPYFHESYRARTRNDQLCNGGAGGRLVAFIQVKSRGTYCRHLGRPPHDYMNVLPVAPLSGYKIKQLPCEFGTVEHCTADGLILCTANYMNYFVVNPLNRTWDVLPQPYFDTHLNLGLVCEENRDVLVPSYRVVGLSTWYDGLEPHSVFIETYSSKTGKWKLSKLVCAEEICSKEMYEYPFVYNGVFHWYIRSNNVLAVYDSKVDDEKYMQLIKLPLDGCYVRLTRSSVDDILWVGLVRYRDCITFWMLPRDENGNNKRKTTITKDEWVLKHTIAIGSVTKEALMVLESQKRKKTTVCDDNMVTSELRFLILVGLISSNPPVAVFQMRPQRIFLYNLETKSIEFVRYRGHPFGRKEHTEWHLFRESLYLSTYAPLARAY